MLMLSVLFLWKIEKIFALLSHNINILVFQINKPFLVGLGINNAIQSFFLYENL